MSFDFGEFSVPTEDGEPQRLSWRDDPERSLSDWTIIVTCGARTQTFNVHKVMLAAGVQLSEYFKSVFTGGGRDLREGISKTTTLELEETAADAFPHYLDFAYTGELNATSLTATALLHLANYLRCRQLYCAVTKFMQGDLCGTNASLYLAEAERYSLEKVAAAALPVCAASIDKDDYLMALPPTLFCRVVGSPNRTCPSEVLSTLVVQYCRGPNGSSVNGTFLDDVTKPEMMPTISPDSALTLIELTVQHKPPNASSLFERCTHACATHWRDSLLPTLEKAAAREAAEDANATVQRQKRRRAEEPTVIAVAPESASALGSTFTFTALGSTIPDTLQVKLLSEALKVAADEATRATLSHRELLADAAKRQNELTAQLKGAVTHCEQLRAELRRFKRIPITETMGVVEESKLEQVTYSIKADSIEMYNHYAFHERRKFGSEAPKQLPTDRPLEHEGWVYKFNCGVMGFEKKVCAVYYFD
jgi:hypothetical protein